MKRYVARRSRIIRNNIDVDGGMIKCELDGAKAQRDAILDGLAIELRTIERDIKTVELEIKETDLAAKVAEPVAETSVLEIAQ